MAKKYPLEQLALIKAKKLEEAERILRDKKGKLTEEEEKLKKVKKERDEVKKHKDDKLQQLRDALDAGERTDKIEQKRTYLKLVKEKLITHDKKVSDQKMQVEKAEREVEEARAQMLKRQRDVEKIKEHRQEWKKELLKEMEQEEAKEADEMGTTRHILRKRQKRQE
jgi:hypothetical protein